MDRTTDYRIFADLDGLIKFVLVLIIATLPFYFEKEVSYGIFLAYLLAVTLASGIRVRTLLLSAASYAIIVLIPYLFGILMNAGLYYLTSSAAFVWQQGYQEMLLRLFRLFIIWYASILYFHTTPIETILGLLDRLLFPLKLIKLPVQDYLKVVGCIVMELKGKGEETRTSFLGNARNLVGGKASRLRSKIKGLSQIIVAVLVDSFQKLDEVEDHIAQTKAEELLYYRFRMTLREGMAASSLSLLLLMIYMVEKGNGWVI